MKIVVFGASRGTGDEVVKQALEAGHVVTAFVRSTDMFILSHDNLNIFKGDALNREQVESAIQGSDAVLSTLGPKGKPGATASAPAKHARAEHSQVGEPVEMRHPDVQGLRAAHGQPGQRAMLPVRVVCS